MRIQETLRRLAAVTAVTAGMLAATAAAAFADPAIVVDPATDLDPAGQSVTVTGSDFTPARGVPSGVYVGQAAIVGGTVVTAPQEAFQWVRPGGPTPAETLNPDGTFTTTLDVVRRFGDVDCLVDDCLIVTWRQHSNPTVGTLYSQSPIEFGAHPKISVTPQSGLDREAPTTVAIAGSGFDPIFNANGLYVAQIAAQSDWWTLSSRDFGPTKYVFPRGRPGAAMDTLNADGTFDTTLDVAPTFTTGNGDDVDCRLVECAIVTFAAHGGNPYRGFDTSTPLATAADVSLSQSTGLDRGAPNAITVAGSDFRPGAPGLYVAVTAVVNGTVAYDQASAVYVRPTGRTPAETLSGTGSFTTGVTVNRTFTPRGGAPVDCAVTACAISTWRAQTVPTPQALFSSSPISFAAEAIAPPLPPRQDPPRQDQPRRDEQRVEPVTPPAIAGVKAARAQKIGRGRVARVAIVTCRATTCRISVPRTVKVKIGRRRFSVRVLAPRSLARGKRGWVRVRLSRRAARALARRRTTAKVRITVRSADERVVRTPRVRISARRASAGRPRSGARRGR